MAAWWRAGSCPAWYWRANAPRRQARQRRQPAELYQSELVEPCACQPPLMSGFWNAGFQRHGHLAAPCGRAAAIRHTGRRRYNPGTHAPADLVAHTRWRAIYPACQLMYMPDRRAEM